MSIRSFVQSGAHYGKLAERTSESYGVIELYDIGEPDTVGAFYTGDHSFQAHPSAWYTDLKIEELLTKQAKKRGTEEQRIKIVTRPRLGKEPPLAEELRRLSHRDVPWVNPRKALAESGNQGDVASGEGKRTKSKAPKAPRTPRAKEEVSIPKGADKQLKEWLAEHGACKAIRLLVHSHKEMNKTSVVAVATQVGINTTTAGVQFTNAKRDIAAGKSEGEGSKKQRGQEKKAAKKAKQPEPITVGVRKGKLVDPEAAFAMGQLKQATKTKKAAKPEPAPRLPVLEKMLAAAFTRKPKAKSKKSKK